ncbi:weak neurotoxin 6-like protein [Lates japonicus]|uniref:Weak neurotoxin 6-like protein n=1 Tax=Lates japonicus TaxID=270547 RepID=A0AAD3NLP7_LATJO|nr:weak neurotoxin 6-like protein [Lates japonicus]
MKLVILSLLVVLVVSQSEALRCNCGGIRNCPGGRVETCHDSDSVCISAFLNNPAGGSAECMLMITVYSSFRTSAKTAMSVQRNFHGYCKATERAALRVEGTGGADPDRSGSTRSRPSGPRWPVLR